MFLALTETAVAKSVRSGAWRSTNPAPVYVNPVYVYPATPVPVAEEDYDYGNSVDAGNIVLINLRVPANAEVSIDGSRTSQTGRLRSFVTPALERGTEYSYEIQARWMRDGKPVEQTRKVTFHAGDRLTLDFRP
jgi:uncharacterized protein (TIGR03000 family)